mmetsp:Transcript_8943/g.17937  ORF Transcript_8943/g.17937 Transcript_8943/m.17937 type:complete len:178 (+) Transcript_8943:172-705(+)
MKRPFKRPFKSFGRSSISKSTSTSKFTFSNSSSLLGSQINNKKSSKKSRGEIAFDEIFDINKNNKNEEGQGVTGGKPPLHKTYKTTTPIMSVTPGQSKAVVLSNMDSNIDSNIDSNMDSSDSSSTIANGGDNKNKKAKVRKRPGRDLTSFFEVKTSFSSSSSSSSSSDESDVDSEQR